jgi:hypothetical protein
MLTAQLDDIVAGVAGTSYASMRHWNVFATGASTLKLPPSRRSCSSVTTAVDAHSWLPSTRYWTRPDDQPNGVREALVPSRSA